MKGRVTLNGPYRSARLQRLGVSNMDIILHVGAHRTATTSFQRYLRDHGPGLKRAGTGVWGPLRTRGGLFSGLFPGPGAAMHRGGAARVKGKVAVNLAKTKARGVTRLLITDENMIGSSRHCLRSGLLFPAVGERMARYDAAFDGRITRVVLAIRSPEMWWSSAAAYAVSRGHGVPDQAKIDRIATMRRSWRDVIVDLACAMPDAQIVVAPFEEHAGRPDLLLAQSTGQQTPRDDHGHWLNRAPDLPALRRILAQRGQNPDLLPDQTGRWHPFSAAQAACMRETYADDLFWLAAGADGLATLTQNPTRKRAGHSQPAGTMREGQHHDSRQRHLAQSG